MDNLITVQTFGAGIEHPLSKGAKLDIEDSSVSFVEAQLKVDASTVKFRSSFSSDIVHHAYVSQVHVCMQDCKSHEILLG